MTVEQSDNLIVQRGNDLHTITIENMSTIQDNDLLLIGRGTDNYKITGEDFKDQTGGGGNPVAPTINSVTLTGNPGTGFSGNTYTTNVVANYGNPFAQTQLKAKVTGELSIAAESSAITAVEDISPNTSQTWSAGCTWTPVTVDAVAAYAFDGSSVFELPGWCIEQSTTATFTPTNPVVGSKLNVYIENSQALSSIKVNNVEVKDGSVTGSNWFEFDLTNGTLTSFAFTRAPDTGGPSPFIMGFEIDGRRLVDGYNTSEAWSSIAAWNGGGAPVQAFDGDTTTYTSGANGAELELTYTFENVTSFRVNLAITRDQSWWINGQPVSPIDWNAGTANNDTRGWWTVPTPSTITSFKIQSSNNSSNNIAAIEVNGRLLVDGVNNSQGWSSGLSNSNYLDGGNWSPQGGFDGSPNLAIATNESNDFSWTGSLDFSNAQIRFVRESGGNPNFKVTGANGETTFSVGAIDPSDISTAALVDVSAVGSPITKILIQTDGSGAAAGFSQVVIDGVVLVDAVNNSQKWSDSATLTGVLYSGAGGPEKIFDGTSATCGPDTDSYVTFTPSLPLTINSSLRLKANVSNESVDAIFAVNGTDQSTVSVGFPRADTIVGPADTWTTIPQSMYGGALTSLKFGYAGTGTTGGSSGSWMSLAGIEIDGVVLVDGSSDPNIRLTLTDNTNLDNGGFVEGNAVKMSGDDSVTGTIAAIGDKSMDLITSNTWLTGETVVNTVANPITITPLTDEIVGLGAIDYSSNTIAQDGFTPAQPAKNLFDGKPSAGGCASALLTGTDYGSATTYVEVDASANPIVSTTGNVECRVYVGNQTVSFVVNGDTNVNAPSSGTDVWVDLGVQTVNTLRIVSRYTGASSTGTSISGIRVNGSDLVTEGTLLTLSGSKDLAQFVAGDDVYQDGDYTVTSSAITGVNSILNIYSDDVTGPDNGAPWVKLNAFNGNLGNAASPSPSNYMVWTPSTPVPCTTGWRYHNYISAPGDSKLLINGVEVTPQNGTSTWSGLYSPPASGFITELKWQRASGSTAIDIAAIEVDGIILVDGANTTTLTLTDDTNLENFRVDDVVQLTEKYVNGVTYSGTVWEGVPANIFSTSGSFGVRSGQTNFIQCAFDPPITSFKAELSSGSSDPGVNQIRYQFNNDGVWHIGDRTSGPTSLPNTPTLVYSFMVSPLDPGGNGAFITSIWSGSTQLLDDDNVPDSYKITSIKDDAAPYQIVTDGGTWSNGYVVSTDTTAATGIVGSTNGNTMTLSSSDESGTKRWIVNGGMKVTMNPKAQVVSTAYLNFDSGTGVVETIGEDPGFKPAPPNNALIFTDPMTGYTWDQELPAGTKLETKVNLVNTEGSVTSDWTAPVMPRQLTADMTNEELEAAHVETALLFATFMNRHQVHCGNKAEETRDALISQLALQGYSLTKILSYL